MGLKTYGQELVTDLLTMLSRKNNKWFAFSLSQKLLKQSQPRRDEHHWRKGEKRASHEVISEEMYLTANLLKNALR